MSDVKPILLLPAPSSPGLQKVHRTDPIADMDTLNRALAAAWTKAVRSDVYEWRWRRKDTYEGFFAGSYLAQARENDRNRQRSAMAADGIRCPDPDWTPRASRPVRYRKGVVL